MDKKLLPVCSVEASELAAACIFQTCWRELQVVNKNSYYMAKFPPLFFFFKFMWSSWTRCLDFWDELVALSDHFDKKKVNFILYLGMIIHSFPWFHTQELNADFPFGISEFVLMSITIWNKERKRERERRRKKRIKKEKKERRKKRADWSILTQPEFGLGRIMTVRNSYISGWKENRPDPTQPNYTPN